MPVHLFIFTHPNHEIGVLGHVKRLQPHMVYITDGGGQVRVNQTREALKGYIPPEKMTFLDYTEQSLYEALLDINVEFYNDIVEKIRGMIARIKPEVVYCDALEFYNPVHDIGLPVALRAMANTDTPLYEVPLVYQAVGANDKYEMQGIPSEFQDRSRIVELTAEELEQKKRTIQSGVYGSLFESLGGMILGSIPTHAHREVIMRARTHLPVPAEGQFLRYDERGKTLLEAGKVKRAISYQQHFVPLFAGFFEPQTEREISKGSSV